MQVFRRPTTGSTLCSSCRQLVGVADEECLNCGQRWPGKRRLLSNLSLEVGFVPMVLWVCGALYLAMLAVDTEGIGTGGAFSFLSPSIGSLFLFGASGAAPVFVYGRWWTVLSAAWLHAGLLHIVFNMMWVRDLGPLIVHFYGASRAVIIYTAAAAAGFIASTVAGAYLGFLPGFLRGAGITVGASAPVFGLLGALLYYGRRGGSAMITRHASTWAGMGLLFGFLLPGIDNWAHLGGLGGGYLVSMALDPLRPEQEGHRAAALICLLASAASIIASIVVGLPPAR